MKHLDNYKIFESKEDIDRICKECNITDYTINNDGSIDVDDDVVFRLKFKRLTLPLKFNRINGSFYCQDNKLTTLKGSPEYVSSYFYCQNNYLTSLEGGPKYVGDNFSCAGNDLTSLEGGPKYVGGGFFCSYNKLTSLEGFPEYIGGHFYCSNNPVYSIVQYFINMKDKDKNNLIELFNYYDIIQDMNVIYDRLKYFYEGIDIKITDSMLDEIKKQGYTIIK